MTELRPNCIGIVLSLAGIISEEEYIETIGAMNLLNLNAYRVKMPLPGDIILFMCALPNMAYGIWHAGLYMENGKILHLNDGEKVEADLAGVKRKYDFCKVEIYRPNSNT